jgi:hypothetical protein
LPVDVESLRGLLHAGTNVVAVEIPRMHPAYPGRFDFQLLAETAPRAAGYVILLVIVAVALIALLLCEQYVLRRRRRLAAIEVGHVAEDDGHGIANLGEADHTALRS